MRDTPLGGQDARAEHAEIIATNVWPVVLLTPDCRILAASGSARDLLASGLAGLESPQFDSYLAEADRQGLLRHVSSVADGGAPILTEIGLARNGQPARLVQLELRPAPDLGQACVTAMIYPSALGHRRNELILGCNRLAPLLLRAQSVQQVYEQVARAIRVFGFGMIVLEHDEGVAVLRQAFDSSGPAFIELLSSAAGYRPSEIAIPLTAPLLRDVIDSGRAVFHPDALALTEALYPPAAVELIRTTQALIGLPGYIYAPMMVEEKLHGILVVWGERLNEEDLPFIEAFALQIAGALAQVELRRAMEQQIQRLNSLATTARAVTTLGELEDVLQVICVQAQQLIGGEAASLALPVPESNLLEVRTATGANEHERGRRVPVEGSLYGKVFTTASGRNIPDIHADPDIYPPSLMNTPIHAAIFQPLTHHGEVLGVLEVAHSQPGFFTQADLDFLGRYAEYAAMAIANARLYRAADSTRRYLDGIIQNAPDAMLIIRPDLTIRPLNTAPIQNRGYSPADVAGQPFLRYCPEERHEELLGRMDAVLRGEPQRFEMELYGRSGEWFNALISADLVHGYDEVLVTVRDISELRRLEANIRQSEKLAALGRLVAGAAHELNNPLAIILGLAQLQLLEELPEETRDDLHAIERAALRAAAIIQQLRLFARPQQLYSEQVDVAAKARDAFARLSAQIASLGITTTRTFSGEPLLIEGEPLQIEQVIFNIMQNAVQALASNPPGARRTLALDAWREPGVIRMRIKDSGPGISHEHLPKIFEPFFTTRDVGQGIGLGLAIAHAIVGQHGGQLWATNGPDQGAVFHLRLPAMQSALATDEAPAALPAGLRILIVEAEGMVRVVAERALTRLGCVVDAAGSAKEALERVVAVSYDLIICALHMPDLDGPALFEQLRVDHRTPWLVLTGDTIGDQSRAFLERTALPVLTKPFTHEQLVRGIAKTLASPMPAPAIQPRIGGETGE
jgi:PAS domain S-box-containing protein